MHVLLTGCFFLHVSEVATSEPLYGKQRFIDVTYTFILSCSIYLLFHSHLLMGQKEHFVLSETLNIKPWLNNGIVFVK